MKHVLTALAITTGLLVSSGAHADLSPEQMAKADKAYAVVKANRVAAQTRASKAELKKATKLFDKPVPGRDCDKPTDDDPMLSCEMEDGTSISVEAVPAKMTQAEAEKQCVNLYAGAPDAVVAVGPNNYVAGVDKTRVELKGNPKQGFLMLWCTTEARDWSVAAAEKRKEWAKPIPSAAPVTTHADFDITYGKKIAFYGSSRQAISVKNNTGTGKQQVFIECGFFLKGELVGTGLGGVGNLMPGATKHTSILALDIEKFDKAECSVKD
jgi:hypothetical protein